MNRQQTQSTDLKKDINALMQSIDVLRDIYKEENAALKNSNARAFLHMQDRKIEAANIYRDRIQSIMGRRDQIKERYPDLSTRLQSMQNEFADLAEQNLRGLKRMQRAGERLFDRIRISAKESVQSKGMFSYRDCGRVSQSRKAIVSTGISETA
jgi:predicted  nucleic acid-binding Zn-ribbon protein